MDSSTNGKAKKFHNVFRDIIVSDPYFVSPEIMLGKIDIPYWRNYIVGYKTLPESYDDNEDLLIQCKCDTGELHGFVKVPKPE